MAEIKENLKQKRKLFYRVETINEEGETIGGYVSALFYLFSLILDVNLEEIDGDMLEANIGFSPEFDRLFMTLGLLCDIPKPEEYIENNENYCLYQKNDFLSDEIYELQTLDDILRDMTDNKYALICKKFLLTDDELIYEDIYQVVISKETYNRHNKNKKMNYIYDMKGW